MILSKGFLRSSEEYYRRRNISQRGLNMPNLKYNKEATQCADCGKELAAKGGFISKDDGKCRCCLCYSSRTPCPVFFIGTRKERKEHQQNKK
jgi:hypothetical protein